jgi:PKD repeat protein
MRKLTLAALLITALACQSKTPSGPGVVTITETTTTTSIPEVITTTIPIPTVADFTFSPITPEELQVVNFNASISTPGSNRTITGYSWDFGDGDPPKTGVRVTHDYVKTGVYLVTLTVTDDSPRPAVVSKTITVRPMIP